MIRFVAEETSQIHLGQIDVTEFPDLGIASFEGKKITAKEITGSIFDGVVTDKVLTVKQVPLTPPNLVSMDQLLMISYFRLLRRNKLKSCDVSD